MKVFISWSGEKSRHIAESLKKWLPSVLQVVRPYFSPEDVGKGSRWEGEISKELEASRVGLLVITPENLEAPWLMFEAGALAKNLEKSKVCPLLFGLEPTDLKGPLVQFQAARFDDQEFKKVMKMMNLELGENALTPEVLEQVFSMWWPKLEQEVNEQLATMESLSNEAPRSDRDMLEEVLLLTRSLSKLESRNTVPLGALEDLVSRYSTLIRAIQTDGASAPVMASAQGLMPPMSYIIERSAVGNRIHRSMVRRLVDDLSRLSDTNMDLSAFDRFNRREMLRKIQSDS